MKYQRKHGTVMGKGLLEPSPDSFHPDSLYWKRQAMSAAEDAAGIMSVGVLSGMMDKMWPDDDDTETWRSIHDGIIVIQDNWWKEQVNQRSADHADLDELRTACRNG